MQLKEIIQKTTQFLRDKGSPSARLDTELLISTALNWDRIKLYLNYEYPLKEDELQKCRELVRRRAAGEPVAYILGKKDFYNHSFKVSSAVLIPRPETETLVEHAVAHAETMLASELQIKIIDLGTGSGCIGLSVLSELPNARLLAVDISPDAIEIAHENASSLSVAERANFLVHDAATLSTDLIENTLGGRADVILANPPYIDPQDPHVDQNVRKYEPAQALFSEDNGIHHLNQWAQTADRLLRSGGMVMFEIGHSQAQAARQVFESIGAFENIQIVNDLSDQNRFIKAFRAQEN